MVTVHPASAEGVAWIEVRAPCTLTRDARVIEARDAKGVIVGAVAFDGWTPSSAQMHVAIETPIAVRALRRAVWPYLFDDCRKSIAFGYVRASNTRALIFDQKLGFRPVARIADGWDVGEDMIVLRKDKPGGDNG